MPGLFLPSVDLPVLILEYIDKHSLEIIECGLVLDIKVPVLENLQTLSRFYLFPSLRPFS